jgi:hypothetical protein
MTNDRDEIYDDDDDDDDDDAYLARRWDGVPELIYSHCYMLCWSRDLSPLLPASFATIVYMSVLCPSL